MTTSLPQEVRHGRTRHRVRRRCITLRGWLYLPDGPQGQVPVIVMAHGFSVVKEI